MAVLLVDVTGDLASLLVSRLVSLSDDVRVVEDDPDAGRKWRRLGAHIARGDSTDADLIERAAQGVRTVVVAQRDGRSLDEVVTAATDAARRLPDDLRLVVCMGRRDAKVERVIRSSDLDYVILRTGAMPRWMPRLGSQRPFVKVLVEAINAADDLAGHPALDLDLTRVEGWRALGLEPPQA